MRTDTEISYEGFSVLFRYMDMIEAERFLTLVQREKFDYTQWRADILEDLTIEEISTLAMKYVRSQEKQVRTESV
ncbi:MAG: hypothetical protein DRI57_15990 [Deltaproteobacteria bacterium]|nr:MAG: hypothetical protein DRI57_15990 [Deltaproteobacteria bacterium]